MKLKTLTIILFLTLTAYVSQANDALIHIVGGGATPTLGLSKNIRIRMESEEVKIELNNKSYIVDATFHFLNKGETEEVLVGFPKRGLGYFDHFKATSPFVRFETWVNGKKVQFTEEPDSASVQGPFYLPDLIKAIKENKAESVFVKDFRWLVKRVQFPAHRKTTTRVLYEAEYQESANCLTASYIYGTGTSWADTIGSALFRIDSSRAPQKEIAVRFPAKRKYSVDEKQISPNIKEFQAKNIKPEPDDELHIFIGACP